MIIAFKLTDQTERFKRDQIFYQDKIGMKSCQSGRRMPRYDFTAEASVTEEEGISLVHVTVNGVRLSSYA